MDNLQTEQEPHKDTSPLGQVLESLNSVLEPLERIKMWGAASRLKHAIVIVQAYAAAELDPDPCPECSTPLAGRPSGCDACDGLQLRACECGDLVRCAGCGGAR